MAQAEVFSERSRSLYAVARPYVVCITFVRPTQPVKFSATSLVPWPFLEIRGKFYGDRPRETPPSEGGG